MNIEIIIEAITQEVEKAVKRNRDRDVAFERMVAEYNNDISPNQDRLGRFHAPVDGYMMPSHLDHFGDPEKIYRKGEFLPTPYYDEEGRMLLAARSERMSEAFGHAASKIKVELPLAIAATELSNDYITLSHGRSWKDGDKDICYLYLKADSKAFQTNVHDKIVEAIQHVVVKEEVIKGEAPTGRVSIRGKVVKAYDVKTEYSYYGEYTTKVLIVLENNATVYGTLPSAWCADELIEDQAIVEFTATFEHAKDTNNHAFYKRPSKFKVIEEEKGA